MIFRTALVLCLAFALAGCVSVRNDIGAGLRGQFSGPTYRLQAFAAEPRAVFDAARSAAERFGFRITRAGAAQGVLGGVSGLASDDSLRGSRQLTFKARLATTADGSTEVAVLFTEVIEDDFEKRTGRATGTPLRDSPLYEAFFDAVSRTLAR